MEEQIILRKIGRNIRKYRERDNLDQNEFGMKIGVSKTYVSFIENGKKEPSIRFLIRAAKCFGVPIKMMFE